MSNSVILWTVAHQAPQSMGFSRQEYQTELPCLLPDDLPDPGTKPTVKPSAGRFFTISATWEAPSICIQFQFKKLLSRVQLFVTPLTVAFQASLSITNSQSPTKPMSIVSVMPSNHLILCHPLLLLPSILPSTRDFSNKSALHIRWPKIWSFSISISTSNEHPGLISFRMDWLDLLAVQGILKSLLSNTTVQKHQFFGTQLLLQSNSQICT